MFRFAVILLSILAMGQSLSGCKSDSRNGSSDSGQVTVVGTVTRIEDNVPSDGGVTIEVAQEKGGTETLYFGSLFTVPRPSEERTQLYEKIRKVTTGDRVEAKGTRRAEGGITLDDIAVMPSN
jgi:hypothetical protein